MSSVRPIDREKWRLTSFWPFQAPELEKKRDLTVLSTLRLDILETTKYDKNLHVLVKTRG